MTIANDLYPGDERSAQLMSGPRIGAGAQIGVNVTILPYVRIGAWRLSGPDPWSLATYLPELSHSAIPLSSAAR